MLSDVLSGWEKCLMETDGIWLLLMFLQFLCRMTRRASNPQFVGRVGTQTQPEFVFCLL